MAVASQLMWRGKGANVVPHRRPQMLPVPSRRCFWEANLHRQQQPSLYLLTSGVPLLSGLGISFLE